MTEVRAAVGDGQGSFRIETIHLEDPQGREVLLQMGASGVCHTDWDSLRWGRRVILGHEGAGVVLRTGPEVNRCKAGDRVLLNWAIPCGLCFQCTRGKENICENRGTVPDARFHEDASPTVPPATMQRRPATPAAPAPVVSTPPSPSAPWPRTPLYPRPLFCRFLPTSPSRWPPFSAAP